MNMTGPWGRACFLSLFFPIVIFIFDFIKAYILR